MGGILQTDPNANLYLLLDDSAVAGANSLTSLAAGSASLSGTGTFNSLAAPSSVDNTVRLDFWLDLELTIFFAVAPTVGRTVDVYLLPSYDGANYADGGSGATPVVSANQFVGSFPVRNVTTKQVINLKGIPIPPTKFQIQIVNSTDQAFAGQNSGTKLKAQTYRERYT